MPFVFLEVRSSAFRETGSQVSRMAGVTREGEYWNSCFVRSFIGLSTTAPALCGTPKCISVFFVKSHGTFW